ncbi:ATP-dependent helicase [Leptothoe sp. PORK10 BA2]|uniref:ATP-dependent helicase n=1 Tax=Leptothoe sp. PORK10 BA2 TaxID=3110254 RepID=UPI002B1FBC88|nr:ATP-dependent helicase [Leptothoe sp. PORK10 BA2]MEA5464553.1 ATP-dependent helicase [Leptothoe sp. PORK10 BA2]
MTVPDRTDQLQTLRDGLRPGQQRLADWRGGPLAVSAVPGSGKSTGMAAGAAIAIAHFQLHGRKQLVLVTFTRSAAANLKAKVRQHLKHLQLPYNSFIVQTLHGLALNIATHNPEVSGISLDTTTLVSPNQSNRLIRTAVEAWTHAAPELYHRLIEGQSFDGEETERQRRQSVLRTEVLPALAYTAIHEAKSSGLQPADLSRIGQQAPPNAYQLLNVAAGLYEQYQILLSQRGLIDYDDMILAALKALDDPDICRRWQTQIFAVFEDEAQDSSPLQTQLLEKLAAHPRSMPPGETELALPPEDRSNLVRVGDPNQAINSTFTPADPVFFNQFCDANRPDRLATIDQAGRSTQKIMTAANYVLQWVNQQFPQDAPPFRPQAIVAVSPDDPQPNANPTPWGQGVELMKPTDINASVKQLAVRVQTLMDDWKQAKEHPEEGTPSSMGMPSPPTLAVLVRENRQGRFIRELLEDPERLGFDFVEATGLQIYDVGSRDRNTQVPLEMLRLLQFIERPHSPDYLKGALRVLVDRQCIPTQDLNPLATHPEQFLYPGPLDPPLTTEAALSARRYGNSLLRARFNLPPYHLIPFLGSTLSYNQSELATADKLAARIAQQTSEDSSLSTMIGALQEIVSSEQFDAIEAEDAEAKYTRPGQLTIITMHKAKGLDWDAVFLPFLHAKLIPGEAWVPPQTEFLSPASLPLSLPDVARVQIRAYIHGQIQNHDSPEIPDLPTAWHRANDLKKAEEFRLLYVAMTRAKRLLWMSAATQAPFAWSNPENLQEAEPCPVLPALGRFMREEGA